MVETTLTAIEATGMVDEHSQLQLDDLSSAKVRPAVCLTDPIPPHGHVIVVADVRVIALGAC